MKRLVRPARRSYPVNEEGFSKVGRELTWTPGARWYLREGAVALKGAAALFFFFLTTPPPAAENRCLLLGVPGGTRWAPQPGSFLPFFSWKHTLVSRNDSAVVNLQHNVQYVHVRHCAQNAKFYFFPLTRSFCSARMLVSFAAVLKLCTMLWQPFLGLQ